MTDRGGRKSRFAAVRCAICPSAATAELIDLGWTMEGASGTVTRAIQASAQDAIMPLGLIGHSWFSHVTIKEADMVVAVWPDADMAALAEGVAKKGTVREKIRMTAIRRISTCLA